MRTKIQNEFKVKFNDKDRNGKGIFNTEETWQIQN